MSNSSKDSPRRHIFALAPNPSDPHDDPVPVEAVFPKRLSSEAALAALIDAAAMDADLEFSEYLELVASAGPIEWQPAKDRGGAPSKNHWKADYGRSAAALGAMVERRLFIRGLLKRPTTKVAITQEVLRRARKEHGKHAFPDDRIKQDAEKLKQAVRGKRPKK